MYKISFIIDGMKNSGGRERVISILSKEFSKRENVEILILDEDSTSFYELDSNVKIVTLGSASKNKVIKKLQQFLKLRKYMKSNSRNIYITLSMRYLNLFVASSNMLLKNRIIATEHCDYFTTPKFFRIMKRILYKKFNYIVTLTEKDRDIYLKKFKNVKRIVNPVSFYPESIESEREKVFLNVGRLTEQKGQDMLIKAWSNVNHNGWKLRLVGEGELESKYKKLINELKLEESVEILKPTKEIMNQYLKSSVFVLSSRWEGLPMVLLEAMACGLPCISFDCETGPRQLIKEGYNGYLVEANNIEQLSKKMNLFVDRSESINMLSNNSRNVARVYSVENVIKEWYSILEEIE